MVSDHNDLARMAIRKIRSGWTTNTEFGAVDSSGIGVPAWTEEAVAFSLVGAMIACCKTAEDDKIFHRLYGRLRVLGRLRNGDRLEDLNTTKEDVLALLERAIQDGVPA